MCFLVAAVDWIYSPLWHALQDQSKDILVNHMKGRVYVFVRVRYVPARVWILFDYATGWEWSVCIEAKLILHLL